MITSFFVILSLKGKCKQSQNNAWSEKLLLGNQHNSDHVLGSISRAYLVSRDNSIQAASAPWSCSFWWRSESGRMIWTRQQLPHGIAQTIQRYPVEQENVELLQLLIAARSLGCKAGWVITYILFTEAPWEFGVKCLHRVFFGQSLLQGKDSLEVGPAHSF